MISHSSYTLRRNRAVEIMKHIYHFMLGNNHSMLIDKVKTVLSYFDKENVSFDEKTLELKFSIAHYYFICQGRVLTTRDDVNATFETYYIVNKLEDRLNSEPVTYKHLKKLSMKTINGGELKTNGDNRNFLPDYCLHLSDYISAFEKDVKYGIVVI